MNEILTSFGSLLSDSGDMLTTVLVFLAAGTFAFSLMAFVRVRNSVKRRTARIMDEGGRQGDSSRVQLEGGDPAARIHHQALLRGQ